MDGCSSICTLESGFTCSATFPTVCTEDCDGVMKGFLPCDTGLANATCCDYCTPWAGCTCNRGGCNENCGIGLLLGIDATKQCDDGVANAGHEYYGDGCNWKCQLEAGFDCTVVGTPCVEYCGNNSLDSYHYECDDGNNFDGDGCNSTCWLETGYYCYNGDPLY